MIITLFKRELEAQKLVHIFSIYLLPRIIFGVLLTTNVAVLWLLEEWHLEKSFRVEIQANFVVKDWNLVCW